MPGEPRRDRHPGLAPCQSAIEDLRREILRRDDTIAALRETLKATYHQLPEDSQARLQARKLSEALLNETETPGAHLDIALEFQRRLMPDIPPEGFPGLRVVARPMSRGSVGGDVYDVFDMGNSCVAFFLGDVSCTGLEAALIMTIARMALRAAAFHDYSPAAVLARVNRELSRNTLPSQFMSAFLGILDTETNRLKFVNAAHCPPVLYGPGRFEALDTQGPYCGMFPDSAFAEKATSVAPGEHLLLFTDGLADAADAAGRRYGTGRIHELVRAEPERNAADLLGAIAQDVRLHTGGRPFADDATLLGVDFVPPPSRANCVTIRTEPRLLSRIEDAIQAELDDHNYGERAIFAVRLAVEEAVINAMKHGNKMDKAKAVTVRWSVDDRQASIAVEDEGAGFDLDAVPDPTLDENLETPHGRGIALMKAYMDEVKFNERGNRVQMVKYAPWRA